jgi:hypothetical protein
VQKVLQLTASHTSSNSLLSHAPLPHAPILYSQDRVRSSALIHGTTGMSESSPLHVVQAVVWDAVKLVQEALGGQGQPGADLGSLQRAAQVVSTI